MNKKQKHMILAVVGVGLQTIGGLCLIAAAVGTMKDINRKIKKTVYQELSKQLAEE